MAGGGFDTSFDTSFDIGADAARLPAWFRGAPRCEVRPANVFCEVRPASLQQPLTGWLPASGGLPALPYGGDLLFEDGDNIQLESGSGVLLLG